jgi:hypothetical protein
MLDAKGTTSGGDFADMDQSQSAPQARAAAKPKAAQVPADTSLDDDIPF